MQHQEGRRRWKRVKEGGDIKIPELLEGRKQEKEGERASEVEEQVESYGRRGGPSIGGRLEVGLRSRGNTSIGSWNLSPVAR